MWIEAKYSNRRVNPFLLSVMVLALAGLLPSNLGAAQQETTPENSRVLASAEQEMATGAKNILATITQSRSTNTRGYKLVIYDDGSATAEIDASSAAVPAEPPRAQQFPRRAIDVKTLQRLLTEIGDVSKIPIGGCAKSASFGTRTLITYAGKTSGDLQCIQQQGSDADSALLQASEGLSRLVQKTLSHLKINDRRNG
jgi:hypothetical protein